MADEVQPDPRLVAGLDSINNALDNVIEQAQAIKAKNTDAENIQYTIFASGLTWGGRSSLLADKDRVQDVAIIFDVVSTTSFTKTYQKSQYALESKAQASDHVQEQDGKFSFSGEVSDVPVYLNEKNYIDRDTDQDKPMESKRSTYAYEVLHRMAKNKEMVGLVTEDDILTGYVITSVGTTRSAESGSSLVFQIEMEEFRRIAIGRVVFGTTTDPTKAGKKNGGAKQTAAGGSVANDEEGKKNPSPYLSKHKGTYQKVDESITGNTYDTPTDTSAKTITPAFNPSSLQR